eukprot:scaffold8054_cov176-Skeletonema_menzelii.AAC.2
MSTAQTVQRSGSSKQNPPPVEKKQKKKLAPIGSPRMTRSRKAKGGTPGNNLLLGFPSNVLEYGHYSLWTYTAVYYLLNLYCGSCIDCQDRHLLSPNYCLLLFDPVPPRLLVY